MTRLTRLTSVVLAGGALLVATIVFLDPWLAWDSGPAHLVLNTVPLVLFGLLAYGVTRRLSTSLLCVILCSVIIFRINGIKVEHLEEPFIFADFYLTPQLIGGRDMFGQYASVTGLAVIVLIAAAFVVSFRLEKPSVGPVAGCGIALAGAAAMITLSFVNYPLGSLYEHIQGDSRPWNYRTLAENQGLMASLVSGSRLTKFTTPEVDEQVIDAFIDAAPVYETDSVPDPATSPDIVLWLSESFFEPGVIRGVNGCEMLPDWCRIKSQGVFSEIAVNTYGGNTTRTEFEVLTGVPFTLLDGHDYPYLSVVNRTMPSIAWTLKERGYDTLAIHTHSRKFWQRHRAFPLLGFDRYQGEETFDDPQREGFWISDRELLERVHTSLPDSGRPLFVFPISMESHGPWGKRKGLDDGRLDRLPAPAGLSEPARRDWQEYLYHARNAVDALGFMAANIRQRSRPTLVVFFGDHLPALESVFSEVEFTDGNDAWQQKLPVVALANYPIDPGWMPDSADELGIWTLHLAGQLDGGAFTDLYTAHETLKRNPDHDLATRALTELQERQLSEIPEGR